MYQGAIAFFKELAAGNAPLYGLLVVFTVAIAALALHGVYTLLFRIGGRLGRHL